MVIQNHESLCIKHSQQLMTVPPENFVKNKSFSQTGSSVRRQMTDISDCTRMLKEFISQLLQRYSHDAGASCNFALSDTLQIALLESCRDQPTFICY